MSPSIANFKVTFEPNPNRRHTRGRRGVNTEGVTSEQVEFEEERLLMDRHSKSVQGTLKGRKKKEHAEAKRFALRGFKGKGFNNLEGSERLDKMKAAARRERIRTGSEITSKGPAARFDREEGLVRVSQKPNIPWLSKKNKPDKRKTSKLQVKPFDLKSALAKFKRTSELPNVSVDVIKDCDHSGLDSRALKKMISTMLIKSGVESNPGPQKRHCHRRLKVTRTCSVKIERGTHGTKACSDPLCPLAKVESCKRTEHVVDGGAIIPCSFDMIQGSPVCRYNVMSAKVSEDMSAFMRETSVQRDMSPPPRTESPKRAICSRNLLEEKASEDMESMGLGELHIVYPVPRPSQPALPESPLNSSKEVPSTSTTEAAALPASEPQQADTVEVEAVTTREVTGERPASAPIKSEVQFSSPLMKELATGGMSAFINMRLVAQRLLHHRAAFDPIHAQMKSAGFHSSLRDRTASLPHRIRIWSPKTRVVNMITSGDLSAQIRHLNHVVPPTKGPVIDNFSGEAGFRFEDFIRSCDIHNMDHRRLMHEFLSVPVQIHVPRIFDQAADGVEPGVKKSTQSWISDWVLSKLPSWLVDHREESTFKYIRPCTNDVRPAFHATASLGRPTVGPVRLEKDEKLGALSPSSRTKTVAENTHKDPLVIKTQRTIFTREPNHSRLLALGASLNFATGFTFGFLHSLGIAVPRFHIPVAFATAVVLWAAKYVYSREVIFSIPNWQTYLMATNNSAEAVIANGKVQIARESQLNVSAHDYVAYQEGSVRMAALTMQGFQASPPRGWGLN